MTPRERVWAALNGEVVDRPPVSFWGHFYHRESSAEDLVDATLEFQNRYRWDWVKLNPRKHYHVEPWGVTYHYSGVPNQKPTLDAWPIRAGEDWSRIESVRHDAGALGEQLAAVRSLRQKLDPNVPMIETVFTPLAILGEMVREPRDLKLHMQTHPERVTRALEVVTGVFERFVGAVLAAGADGIYLATVDWAARDLMTPDEYRRWARPYDERLLRAAAAARFNVLHVCRANNQILELADYPVHAFSWADDAAGNPPLGEMLKHTRAAVMGGIPHEGAIHRDDEAAVLDALRRGFEQTGGRRWLVAPTCSIPPTVRPEQLDRLRNAIETASPMPGR